MGYKKNIDKYWENETGETIEFGTKFMCCYDNAGKLQFGNIYYDPRTGEKKHKIGFVLDREELFNSKEGMPYLMQTLEDWEQMMKGSQNDN